VPLDGVVPIAWRDAVIERDAQGRSRINRITYEICALQALREQLRCKEIWVEGADRYRNPDEDLPTDFETRRAEHYAALGLPWDADAFIARVQADMTAALTTFDSGLATNPFVRILKRGGGRIALTPLEKQEDAAGLAALKTEIGRRWPMTSLLDMLKEADLRIGFTSAFRTVTDHENLSRAALQERLLLCLNGIGTNTGLKHMAAGQDDVTYRDLLYVRRRFITRESMREAIAQVVNATLRARHPGIWGEGTTACAADSKQFGAWDQNLMTEWHVRYGGRGVMIYWHVERHSTCIYSQLKTPSSSEVAAMIEGVLAKGLRRQPWAKRRCLRLLPSARVPPSATAQAYPCPAALSPDRRRTRRVPGIATSAVTADRLGSDPSPVQRDGEVRDGTSTRHCSCGGHPAPFHPRQSAAPHVQSFGRAW